MVCPVCGVVNEPHRRRCDCGFELDSPEERVAQELQRRMADVAPQMWIGAGVFGLALLVTILTRVGASKVGGDWFILTGAMLGGLTIGVRAFFRWSDLRARLPSSRR